MMMAAMFAMFHSRLGRRGKSSRWLCRVCRLAIGAVRSHRDRCMDLVALLGEINEDLCTNLSKVDHLPWAVGPGSDVKFDHRLHNVCHTGVRGPAGCDLDA